MTLVLAGFLAGPGLRAHCFVSCADRLQPAAPSGGCHDESATGAALAEAHTCATDALQVTPAAKRAGLETAAGLTLSPQPMSAPAPRLPQLERPAVISIDTGPPGTSFLIPLRI